MNQFYIANPLKNHLKGVCIFVFSPMADDVHFQLEKMVPELQDLEKRGVFTSVIQVNSVGNQGNHQKENSV